jgi:hypothetical protein
MPDFFKTKIFYSGERRRSEGGGGVRRKKERKVKLDVLFTLSELIMLMLILF